MSVARNGVGRGNLRWPRCCGCRGRHAHHYCCRREGGAVRPDPRMVGRPPRRGADRLEDAATWLLMAVALTVLVGSAVVGVLVHTRSMDAARAQAAERTSVTATALADSPVLPTSDGFDP